jgi:nicotinamide-nucleotide adenylyltransferase
VRGLFVGRFQPFHRGHLELVRTVIASDPSRRLLVVVGSAEKSFTWENPFTAGERFEMMGRALEEASIPRVDIVPVADIDRHGLWVRHLEELLPPFDRIYSHNPLTLRLFQRAGYPTESPPLIERTRLEGSRVRDKLSRGQDVSELLPPAVAQYLAEIDAAERLKTLRPAGASVPTHRRTAEG